MKKLCRRQDLKYNCLWAKRKSSNNRYQNFTGSLILKHGQNLSFNNIKKLLSYNKTCTCAIDNSIKKFRNFFKLTLFYIFTHSQIYRVIISILS